MKGDIAMVRTVWAEELRVGDKLWCEFGYRTVRRWGVFDCSRGRFVAVKVNGIVQPLRFRPREHVLLAIAVHTP